MIPTVELVQVVVYLGVLIALVKPLGGYMARVYQGERTLLSPILAPAERGLYRLAGIDPDEEMPWYTYAIAMLVFNAIGMVVLYGLERLQAVLPLNPAGQGAVVPHIAFNTAVSFTSNTNWQFYGGETTMSHLTQMLGLTVQNFVSAAVGMAVLVALIRGIVRHTASTIGNFWVDLTRSVLYVLLPLAIVLALLLASQGVVQTLLPYQTATLLDPTSTGGQTVTEQVIAVGPAASQLAIKQLGTNGGGFFNTNASHPLENPTPLSNFLEMLAILLIPAALCYTFGTLVGDTRQGWALLAAMLVVFVALLATTAWSEQRGNPILDSLGVDQLASATQAGGNMEGKEVRFGPVASALWATATTAASNGSVNSMHDSYTPLGSLGPLLLMQLGEVIFGGVGSGLYGLLAFVIVAVFVAGQMVGRTPEYLSKKIEAYEMKMAAIAILVPPATVLLFTGLALASGFGRSAMQDLGPHGFTEVLYAFSSQGNNNGSAFAGISTNVWMSLTGGIAMLLARYWVALPMLAIAGSLVRKKKVPVSSGTLPTHTPLFVGWLIMVVLTVGALSFFPALALGPIVEHLLMLQGAAF